MRKLLMFVALVLGMVSCQNDLDGFDVNVAGEKEVVVSVSLPEGTRANSAVGAISNDVVKSNEYTLRYIFQVWDEAKKQQKDAVIEYSDETTVSFPVRLVPGRNYRFVVWADVVREADKKDLHYDTTDFPTICLSSNPDTWVAMDETRDAYTASELIEEFSGSENYTITLKRPFAKLRVITTDMNELMGLSPVSATVTYTTDHYNTFDALNGEVSGKVEPKKSHTFNYADVTAYDAPAENQMVLFADYFFAADETVSFNLTVGMSDGDDVERPFSTDIPVKRNHLTTLIGDVLTEGNDIEVRIDEGFDDETIVNTSAKCSIYYTATSKIEIDPTKWGANIVSDEWNATTGRGVIGFDNDIKEIPYQAFKDNVNLTSIKIPETVTWISFDTFCGCLNLAKFEGKFAADNGVCLIINNRFEYFALGCGLTEYVVPNSVKSISGSAFASCPSLMEVTIPENVNTIEYSAFRNCSNLKTVNIANSVTSIGGNAFYGCTNLVNINLPSNLSKIAYSTFEGCTSIKTIDIPKSVATIEHSAFEECQSLISIDLPQNITSIESSVFSGCTSLESITIPEGVSKIGTKAFYYCKSLDNITLPNALREFGEKAFMSCYTLSNIVIPEGVCELPNSLFYNCSNLVNVVIPKSVNFIDERVFYACRSLKSAIIPEGVQKIPYMAFDECSSLETVVIPNSVTAIQWHAFENCSSLSSVTIPEGVTSMGEFAFSGCSSLKSANIPSGITSIQRYLFAGCESLESIIIPDGVTSIGWSAFENCKSLKTVTIPSKVTSIGIYAFLGCKNITEMYFKPVVPPTISDHWPLDGHASGRIIYVPASDDDSIINAYKSASIWKSYYANELVEYNF